MQHVAKEHLRNSLFVLWIGLVSMKMTTFVLLAVPIDWWLALVLIPAAAIGHLVGLKAHHYMLRNDRTFKRWIGCALLLISVIGGIKLLFL